jgi:hypothetical protein
VGNREDVEKAIRMLFVLPVALTCAIVADRLLKMGLLGVVAGGAVGGGVGGLLGEGVVRLLRKLWPPRN